MMLVEPVCGGKTIASKREAVSVREDPKFAACSACGQKISRGETNTRTYMYSIGSVIGIGRYLLV